MDPLILLLMIGFPLASQAVASALRRRFVLHSREPMPMTGAEIARRMLAENNINDVQVIPTKGQLTDHYNPANKTVALSEVVYSQANVAACAVAAHECGHAVQDATGYPLLTLRSKMVPLLKLSNVALPVIAFGGAGISALQGANVIAYGLLGLLALPTLFSLVTLPVEFNASRRALNWMEDSGVVVGERHASAKNALWWAAMTYVVAALGSIAQVVYFARYLLAAGRR
jgi:Zn-dependent membrane protease YugP